MVARVVFSPKWVWGEAALLHATSHGVTSGKPLGFSEPQFWSPSSGCEGGSKPRQRGVVVTLGRHICLPGKGRRALPSMVGLCSWSRKGPPPEGACVQQVR